MSMSSSTSIAYPNVPDYFDYFKAPEMIYPHRNIWRDVKFLLDYSSQLSWPQTLSLDKLPTKKLRQPIHVVVEPDDNYYLAQCPDLPLYGYGSSMNEAVEMLKREIESLYTDLQKDDLFTEDWDPIKSFLEERIN